MATAAQIRAESWYQREQVPAPLDTLVDDLCVFYRVPRTNGGTKGNEAHRTGRHRSAEWVANSRYCTRDTYGTVDARDRRGNPRHIRAFDFEFATDAQFWAACHRIDTAVRAGKLPQLAEWFGTFDGRTVVGWYEGHASSSDSSHLKHLHGGFWTEFADDPAACQAVFDTITGEGEDEDMTPDQEKKLNAIYSAMFDGGPSCGKPVDPANVVNDSVNAKTYRNGVFSQLAELRAKPAADVDEAALAAALAPLIDAGASPAEVAAAVRAELDKTRLGGS